MKPNLNGEYYAGWNDTMEALAELPDDVVLGRAEECWLREVQQLPRIDYKAGMVDAFAFVLGWKEIAYHISAGMRQTLRKVTG